MLPFRLVYHEGYDLNLGDHIFPARKYRLIRDRLIEESLAREEDFVEPSPASAEQLRLVHSAEWIRKLETGTLTQQETARLGIPWSEKMVQAFRLAAGGNILAGRLALRDGVGFNVGGGFQHGFCGYGEGFSAVNDVAVAIRTLQHEVNVKTAMVVDCDVHHGNGTATIFDGDDSVFTFSIHQFNNYPLAKPCSDLDIHLPDGADDTEYHARLTEGLRLAFTRSHPELVVYVAGADPYFGDLLGGLTLTLDGLWKRDRLVIETALRHGAAVVVTLGGGYARQVLDTVAIHVNTARVIKEVLEAGRWQFGA